MHPFCVSSTRSLSTPRPQVTPLNGNEQEGGLIDESSQLGFNHVDFPVPSHGSKINTEDPRRYLIARERSRAIHGRPRRLSSHRLPLEIIPSDMEVVNTSQNLKVRHLDIKQKSCQFARWEPYLITGSVGHGLPFTKMGEARCMESRLRRIVEIWAKSSAEEVHVEYCLIAGAKGKGAC